MRRKKTGSKNIKFALSKFSILLAIFLSIVKVIEKSCNLFILIK